MRIFSLVVVIAFFLNGCAVVREPVTSQEIEQRVEDDLASMQAGQQAVGEEPITLNEAMARAIMYNLDHRLKMMEVALANKQLAVSRYDLLPAITASAGYSNRGNDLGSYSESLADGSESLVSSTAQEKDSFTADLKIAWNVLDFGVSYIRIQQESDQIFILKERQRKVVQNIIQDVRYAYWRAVCADRLVSQMVDLMEKSKSALKRSKKITEQGLVAPKEALEYQRALLENIRMLWEIIQRLSPAKTELASLMNLPPGTSYQLVEPKWDNPEIPGFATRVSELEQLALISRPELVEEDYHARISALDVRKTMLQMLPGLELQLGYNYDSNKYLYNEDWWNAGAFLSQKIFNIFSGPERIKAAEAQDDLVNLRRKALSMAVMLQVRLAHQHYHLVKRQYLVNRNLDEINFKLNDQMIKESLAGRSDELTAIRSATNAMVARMRHYLAYAEMQNAAGRLYNSLGLDPLPEETTTGNLSVMAETLDSSFVRWNNLVNQLGEAAAAEEDEDSSVDQILAAFDRDLDFAAATNQRTGVSYNYDWLDRSFTAPLPEEKQTPTMQPSPRARTEQGGLPEAVVVESLGEEEPPEHVSVPVPGQVQAPARVAMKSKGDITSGILFPVDESIYAPKNVSMVSRGLDQGRMRMLPFVDRGAAGSVRVPMVAKGFSAKELYRLPPAGSGGGARKIKLTPLAVND